MKNTDVDYSRGIITTAMTEAVEQFNVDAQTFAEPFTIDLSIFLNNTELIRDVQYDAVFTAAYRLVHHVYGINRESDLLVPASWFDHFKDAMITKMPFLNSYIKVNYTHYRMNIITVFPNETVTSPSRVFEKTQKRDFAYYRLDQ